jgi:hypothetical protein
VLDEARGKREAKVLDTNTMISDPNTETMYCSSGNMSRTGNSGNTINANLQQPYYQTHAYGPRGQPMTGAYSARPNITPTAAGGAHAGMSENVREQVARTLREFGLEPKS